MLLEQLGRQDWLVQRLVQDALLLWKVHLELGQVQIPPVAAICVPAKLKTR